MNKIDDDPEFRKKWDRELEKISDNIIRQNETIVFLANDNEEEYQKQLSEIYNYNDINFRKIYEENMRENVAEWSSNSIPENIENMSENCPWYLRARYKLRGWLGLDKEERQKIEKKVTPPEPIYYKHTDIKRVSNVQYREICDFRTDFLLQRRADMRLNQAQENIDLAAAQRAQKIADNTPDELYGRKANQVLKAAPLTISGGRE